MTDIEKKKPIKYNPTVTIAIPTYNRADNYFRQTLESALAQNYKNIEIVIADNCSTDDTNEFLNGFSDSRLKYFRHNKNIQANENFNFCLDQAQGEYFLLLHDDDLIDDDFIETCMNSVEKHTDIGIIRTGTRIIDENNHVLYQNPNMDEGLSFEELIEKWFSWKNSIYLCSTIFNTKRLKEIGGFASKHNLFQDCLAEFKLSSKYGRIDIQQIKASFREHTSANTARAKVIHWCEDSIFVLDSICGLVNGNKVFFRKKGLKYFSTFNYNLVTTIKSPLSRIATYFILFKYFKLVFLSQSFSRVLHKTPLYPPLRFIKRNLMKF
jgi:glycosyltransferase involved in cell wall biosynthesis